MNKDMPLKTNAVDAGPPALKHFQTDDGARIPLHVRGKGPALVMVHGWTGRWQDWQSVIRRLEKNFTCYLWEARPYQASLANPTIERMARDLQNLLEFYRLERPILMGHSMGALTLWEYLRQFGDDRAAALCFIDQSPRLITGSDWDKGLYGRYSAEDDAAFVQALKAGFADAVVDDLIRKSRDDMTGNAAAEMMLEVRRRFLHSLAPDPWIAAWQSFSGKDYRDVLPTIRVPTFLAYGEACSFYGPRVAEYVQTQTPGAELRVYADAGHSPHFELPDAFAHDFLAFAARHGVHA